MFFLCALEFHNVKNETPKPHLGDKGPQHIKKLKLPSHIIGFQPKAKLIENQHSLIKTQQMSLIQLLL
jgi:hypothetical protein